MTSFVPEILNIAIELVDDLIWADANFVECYLCYICLSKTKPQRKMTSFVPEILNIAIELVDDLIWADANFVECY